MIVARDIAGARATIAEWRCSGRRIGFVPTMGALHDGHLALVDAAAACCDMTVASIFVNPLQFGPTEDFDRYPRNEARDLELLERRGCRLAFCPSTSELLPAASSLPPAIVQTGELGSTLCGRYRPGHFDAIATQVLRLLMVVMPDVVAFGEKDYQQLQVVRAVVRDLRVPVRVVALPTVREADGLAMSSRNLYLTADQRRRAPALYRTLCRTSENLRAGTEVREALAAAERSLVEAGFEEVQYLTLADRASLQPLAALGAGARLLAAAHLGRTRLIDNVDVEGREAIAAGG